MKKVQQLSDTIQVKRPLPENIVDAHKSGFIREETRVIPPCFLYKFSNVNFLSDGTIFKYFLPYIESFVSVLANHRIHNYKGLLKLYLVWPKKKLNQNKKYLIVHDAWSKGYYHWLTDFLPRLYLSRDILEDVTLLIPSKYTEPFQQECLALFNIRNIEYLSDKTIYKAKSLYFVNHLAHLGNYHPDVLKGMVSYIMNKIGISNLPIPEDKIYISRKDAPRRKIVNDNEVEEYLLTLGFKIILLENYSFTEQIELCSKAKYMVSIHGAGLSNMIFMQPNCSIFELRMAENNENYFFYTLAAAMDLKFYYQYCSAADNRNSVQDSDIIVDMEHFKNSITKMLLN